MSFETFWAWRHLIGLAVFLCAVPLLWMAYRHELQFVEVTPQQRAFGVAVLLALALAGASLSAAPYVDVCHQMPYWWQCLVCGRCF